MPRGCHPLASHTVEYARAYKLYSSFRFGGIGVYVFLELVKNKTCARQVHHPTARRMDAEVLAVGERQAVRVRRSKGDLLTRDETVWEHPGGADAVAIA